MRKQVLGNKIIPMLAALLYAAFLAPATQAAEQRKVTMFLPNTNWPPYIMDGSHQRAGGILGEVFEAIAGPLGYSLRIKYLPERRGREMLDDGLVDINAMARKWVPDPDRYIWTDPFMLSEDVLLSTEKTPLHFTTPEALYGKTLAAIRGFVYPKLEPHFGPGKITRVDVTTPHEMMRLLGRGRVDGAMVNRAGTQWMLKQHSEFNAGLYHLDETAFDSAAYRFLFRKDGNWGPVRDQFNKALRAMKKDGRLKKILDQYR